YFSFARAGNAEAAKEFSVVNGSIIGIVLDSRAVLIGTAGSSGWYTSAGNVTLLLMNGTSPPDSIWYRLDNGTWTQYAQSFAVVGDGVHTLDFNATDGAGLNEIVHHLIIPIDTALPTSSPTVTGTSGNNGWYISNATVSLGATDATSGVRGLTYRIDGPDWLAYAGPVSLGEGRHLAEFYASDVAGLTEVVRSIAVSVDTVAPTSVADLSGQSGANGWFISNVTVVLNATDATSGVAGISYRIGTGAWLSYAGPFVLGEGRHHVEYYATDVAGIVEASHALDVSIDTTPPTAVAAISGTLGFKGWLISNLRVSLNASDATSGIASLSYRVDGWGWTTHSGAFVIPDGP